jgi:hypothetical protein
MKRRLLLQAVLGTLANPSLVYAQSLIGVVPSIQGTESNGHDYFNAGTEPYSRHDWYRDPWGPRFDRAIIPSVILGYLT